MDISLTLTVDLDDADPDNDTGLTEEAFMRLMSALGDAGFDVASGPWIESAIYGA